MKKMKVIFALMLAMAGFQAMAAIDDAVFLIKDAPAIVQSEQTEYALVWTTNDVEFAGFNADGSLVEPEKSKVMVKIPGSKLKTTLVQMPKGMGGSFSLHQLNYENEQVKEYATLASGYEYKEQFEKMPMLDSIQITQTKDYKEPEPIVVAEVEPPKPGPVVEPKKPTPPGQAKKPEPKTPEVMKPAPAAVVSIPLKPKKVVGTLPTKFTKNLVKHKWNSMYKKLDGVPVHEVFKKKATKVGTYQSQIYIMKCSVYNLVPETYLDVCNEKKYLNKFSEHWVVDTLYVVGKDSATTFEVDEHYGLIEVETVKFKKNEKSKLIRELKK